MPGKSTVSTMLAERGAVIVDADKIARDLQAPGARCSTAWPIGSATTSSRADGSLDRAAVAAIVFNDKARPRRPERHRPPGDAGRDPTSDRRPSRTPTAWSCSTSRCSARTRGWGWRRRSSSTSRSTRRSIGWSSQRGMDVDDATARINSQICRDERLAKATHVIDNSGDRRRAAQPGRRAVDRTRRWQPRRGEPTPPDRVASAGTVRPATWVFGYGSLVDPESLGRTLGRVGDAGCRLPRGRTARLGPPLELRRRSRHRHVAASRTASSIDDGVIVALGVVAAADEAVNGIVARVSRRRDSPRSIVRERDYDRVDVTDSVTCRFVTTALEPDDRIVTYVPRPSAIERYERARDEGEPASAVRTGGSSTRRSPCGALTSSNGTGRRPHRPMSRWWRCPNRRCTERRLRRRREPGVGIIAVAMYDDRQRS